MIKTPKGILIDFVNRERLLNELSMLCSTEDWRNHSKLSCKELETIKDHLLCGIPIEDIIPRYIKSK